MSKDDSKNIIEHLDFEKINKIIVTDNSLDSNKDSFDMAHQDSMIEHASKYTALLDVYVSNSSKNLSQKITFKSVFFYFSISSLSVITILFFIACIGAIFLQKADALNVTALSAVGTTFASVLSMYIVIPRIIAKYLFNIKEDQNMTEIIKSIQNYDERVDLHNIKQYSNVKTNKKKAKKGA